MRVTTFNMNDAMVWGQGEGESKIRLYRKLHNHSEVFSGLNATTPTDQAATDDEIAAKVMALLKPALIVMTYSNAWTGDRSVELFDSLNAIRTDVLKAGVRLSAAKSDQAKKADITKIFSQFGLVVKKHETTNKQFFYTITTKSLKQMTRYI